MIWIKSTISGILDRPFWPLILMVFPWKLIIRQKEVKSWFSTQWCCRLCWSRWSGSCLAQYFINFLFGRLNKRALFFWKKFILIEICGTEDQRTVSGHLGKICLWIIYTSTDFTFVFSLHFLFLGFLILTVFEAEFGVSRIKTLPMILDDNNLGFISWGLDIENNLALVSSSKLGHDWYTIFFCIFLTISRCLANFAALKRLTQQSKQIFHETSWYLGISVWSEKLTS